MAEFPSFLWPCDIPLCVRVLVYACHIFFIHSPISGHVRRLHVLAIVNNAAVNMGGMDLCKLVFSFPLGKYLEVEWLGHPVVPVLFWGEPLYVFHRGYTSLHPTSSALGFPFLHSLANTCYFFFSFFFLFFFFLIIHSDRCEGTSHCGFDGISLMPGDTEHLFKYLLAICASSLEKYPLDPLPLIQLRCLFRY